MKTVEPTNRATTSCSCSTSATSTAALAIAERVQPWFGVVKVGLELYAEAGPVAFEALRDKGFRVFADLKLHDIPNTVGHARARVLGRRGVDFLNFHAAGGVDMLRAGVEGLATARATAARDVRSRSRSQCSRVNPNIDALEQRMQIAARRRVRRRRVRGHRRRGRARASGCARWCPASGSRVATRTIRRASTRRVTRSRAAPTGS